MPELPEVETVRRGLAGPLTGRRLLRVTQRRADLRWPLPERFAARLAGRRVERLERRAKYILAHLDDATVWLIHLGMSGRMYIAPGPAPPPGPHEHVTIETDDGAVVRYEDARRFGMMDLVPAARLHEHRLLAGLGPEPLGNGFNEIVLSQALTGRRTPIKAALLDQRVVAGLGNIYVSEALFRARISPRRLAASVAGVRAGRLVPAIRMVLEEAIAAGGSTLRDYVQTTGELGYFQHAFQVYDREGAPCIACTRPVRRIVQSGRASYFCGHCQR
jgi:formamidopyrimidine-DNA glycosylase